MKRVNPYIILGSLCILAGALGFLQAFGLLENASDVFWGVVFLLGGLAFLTVFLGGQWWAVIPALALAGIGALILLPASLEQFGGALFLGAVGSSFWVVYLTGRKKWWAILPGGVALTLAVVAGLPGELDDALLGVAFFTGLAVTFLLVALLAGMHWAYWPALSLGVVAALVFSTGWLPLANYVWAIALVGAGMFVIWRAFCPKI
ncbi:MAG: hypothetical protein ACOYYJ_14590 [Chloroflexota bacterium]